MRILKMIIGLDNHTDKLLLNALKLAIYKVVVKRSKNAELLSNKKPHLSIKNKKYRFDIYIP